MCSKASRRFLFVVIGLAVLAGGCATNSASNTDESCTPAGTWRGGSAYDPDGDPYEDLGVRYVCSIVPIGNGRFSAIWEGSYVTPPDYARMTQYCGEIVRKSDGGYEGIGMAYFNTSSTFPPESLPEVWVIHGDLEMPDCDTLKFTWDTFAAFDWQSEPFVDDPLFEPVPTPIIEVYKRFKMPGD